jgi:peroxiredoxin
MKAGPNVIALTLVALISVWGLSGCSKAEPAIASNTDTPAKETPKADKSAKHAEAKTAGPKGKEPAKHDHHGKGGHKRGEHKDHKTGEHRDHGAGGHHDNEPALPGVKVGDKVPDFSVRTLDGKSVTLSELQKDAKRTKNGVVVLSFWCMVCHSCRDVEEFLAKLAKDYAGQAAVFALDANFNETAEGVTAFVKENELDLPIVLDPSGNTADLFGVKRTTTTVVIDGNGVLRYCGQFRQKDGGSAEAALTAVLAGKEVAIKTTPHNG